MLALLFCGEFLLHILCWLNFLIGGLSLTLPVLVCFFCYQGSFSYLSRAGFIFIWGVSLTQPVLALILSRHFLVHIPYWLHFYQESFSYTSHAGFFFYAGNFSYTSHDAFIFCGGSSSDISQATFIFMWRVNFIFMWGVSLTHPVLASFYAGSFSYTFRAGFLLREERLSCAVYSENNPLIKELGGSWPRRKVWKSHTQTREGSPRTTWTEQNKIKQELSGKWAQKWKRKKRNGSEI